MNERIIPFTYNIKSDKKRAFPLFFAVLALSFAVVILSVISPKYQGVISLVAVVGLTASVLIYQRYVTADYGYVVTEGESNLAALLFTKRLGKRVTTMAYLPLYSIISIQKFTKEELKEHKVAKGVRKYNFAPTLNPDFVYVISSRTGEAEFEIAIECIPEVAERILEYSAYAKEDYVISRNDDEE